MSLSVPLSLPYRQQHKEEASDSNEDEDETEFGATSFESDAFENSGIRTYSVSHQNQSSEILKDLAISFEMIAIGTKELV